MTADDMARIHAQAMTVPAPWHAADFDGFLSQTGVFLVWPNTLPPNAFALGRRVLDEAELLTVAVDPTHQGQGLGRACLALFEERASAMGASRLHLEVAETNVVALSLYHSCGWQPVGHRKAYYEGANGRIDAVLMTKQLS